MGTFEIIALYKIKEGEGIHIDADILDSLEGANLVQRAGFRVIDLKRVYLTFEKAENVKMADFAEVFIKDLTRARVKSLVDKLTGVILDKHGSGSGTYYNLKKAVKTFEGVLSLVSK